jgi:hypothetical protein
VRALSFAAGAAIALIVWWYATPAYDGLLCRALHYAGVSAQPVDRFVEVTRLNASRARVAADQLTYNVILFGGLLAAIPPKRIERGLLAFLALVVTHIAALYVSIQATWATEMSFWKSVEFIYRIGGMFAIAFVCWYATTPSDRARESQRGTSKAPVRRGPGSRPARGSRR